MLCLQDISTKAQRHMLYKSSDMCNVLDVLSLWWYAQQANIWSAGQTQDMLLQGNLNVCKRMISFQVANLLCSRIHDDDEGLAGHYMRDVIGSCF